MKKQDSNDTFSSLERDALIASGLTGESRISDYMKKLDHIHQQAFHGIKDTDDLTYKARALFGWLWEGKPFRYRSKGSFRLDQVMDSQLNDSLRSVGNCLGLTLLYNCLLRKSGIFAQALYIENAFGRGPHVITILSTGDGLLDIENILPDGFDYRGHLHRPSRTKWGDKELIADIYLSIGNECFEKGEPTEALKNYEKAIALNPAYEKAHINRVILKGKTAGK
ncbi:tetratricopeptide repeat protein [Thermodesulfobacteriota bacterium]